MVGGFKTDPRKRHARPQLARVSRAGLRIRETSKNSTARNVHQIRLAASPQRALSAFSMVTMSDPNINQETGETMMGRSPRFTMWVAFLVFATITMGSAVEVVSRPRVFALLRGDSDALLLAHWPITNLCESQCCDSSQKSGSGSLPWSRKAHSCIGSFVQRVVLYLAPTWVVSSRTLVLSKLTSSSC